MAEILRGLCDEHDSGRNLVFRVVCKELEEDRIHQSLVPDLNLDWHIALQEVVAQIGETKQGMLSLPPMVLEVSLKLTRQILLLAGGSAEP